tara:strand:- start:4273 stop:5337 length:1065 start_codon:yes stop_codon:yes gene_type:complete
MKDKFLFEINKRKIGLKYPPYVIAEISGNHSHDIKKAFKFVDKIKELKIDAIKLQTFTPDKITINSKSKEFTINDKKSIWNGRKLFDLYNEAHMPWAMQEEVIEYAHKSNVTCFSSPFDETAVDFLEKMNVPAYKVASFEINHIPLLERIGKTKKPVILSTGLAYMQEIRLAINTLKKNGCKNLALLKCTSNYPADPSFSNLETIRDMRKKFHCEVGLSDHTKGIGVAIASIVFGSSIIEKHITLDTNDGAVDSKFSLEPKDFKRLKIEVENCWKSIGKITYGPTQDDKKNLKFKRSIYFIKNIKKNQKLTNDDIGIFRPNNGVEPKYLKKIIGKKLNKNIKKNTPVKLKDFKI